MADANTGTVKPIDAMYGLVLTTSVAVTVVTATSGASARSAFQSAVSVVIVVLWLWSRHLRGTPAESIVEDEAPSGPEIEPGDRVFVVLHDGEPDPGVLGSRRVEGVAPIGAIVPRDGSLTVEFPLLPHTVYDPYVTVWRGEEFVALVNVTYGSPPREISKGHGLIVDLVLRPVVGRAFL